MEPVRPRAVDRARKLSPEKPSAFHGKVPAGDRTLRRPRTLPNLMSASKGDSTARIQESSQAAKRVPSKVRLNVTVRGSLAALQIMASTDWTAGDLIAALLQQYAKEGRRPRLPSAEPSDFGLHYSQFSLQGLDPEEKLIKLGSRNFFLCPKPCADLSRAIVAPPGSAAEMTSGGSSWAGLRFVDFLL